MDSLTPALVIAYSTFAIFHFYMTSHVKNFEGASRGFELLLTFYTFIGLVFQYGFLIWFGLKHSWVGGGLLLIFGFVAFLVLMPIELLLRKHVHKDVPILFSLLGFIVLPVCALFMLRATA